MCTIVVSMTKLYSIGTKFAPTDQSRLASNLNALYSSVGNPPVAIRPAFGTTLFAAVTPSAAGSEIGAVALTYSSVDLDMFRVAFSSSSASMQVRITWSHGK